MPRNNSKARRQWRKARATNPKPADYAERLLFKIFGKNKGWGDPKPGTDEV